MGGLTPHISSPTCLNSPGHLKHYKDLMSIRNKGQEKMDDEMGFIRVGVMEKAMDSDARVDQMLRIMEAEQRASHFSI